MASPVANKPSTGSDNGNIVTQAGVILPDDVLEKLYQSYSLKQKRAGLSCFLVTSILFDIWAIFIPQGQSWESIGKFALKVIVVFFFLHIKLFILFSSISCCQHLSHSQHLVACIFTFVQQQSVEFNQIVSMDGSSPYSMVSSNIAVIFAIIFARNYYAKVKLIPN